MTERPCLILITLVLSIEPTRAHARPLDAKRSLDEEFPTSMRTRAAAALHKVLTFQDVRRRVEDVAPSTVPPLVRLLRQDGSSKTQMQAARCRVKTLGATSSEGELRQPRRKGRRMHPEEHEHKHLKEQPRGAWLAGEGDSGVEAGDQNDGMVMLYPRHCSCDEWMMCLCWAQHQLALPSNPRPLDGVPLCPP